jgi:mono/diheme cytochrome c family protein
MHARDAVALMAITAGLALAACSHASRTSQASGNSTGDATLAAGVTSVGNRDAGRAIFATNCASCHGATGVEGGVGPSLHNERERKNDDATIAWIENPAPPMPKLYPSILTQAEVVDVAAYVQSL